ncbi:hypothetical protein J6590_029614 [Homalodisca vitripennis]|nr:hypothetical protein J6590_029614 [Homalodisca vitripennis]
MDSKSWAFPYTKCSQGIVTASGWEFPQNGGTQVAGASRFQMFPERDELIRSLSLNSDIGGLRSLREGAEGRKRGRVYRCLTELIINMRDHIEPGWGGGETRLISDGDVRSMPTSRLRAYVPAHA